MGNAKDEEGIKTNEEYREELRKMFEGVDENYKLKWFYQFIGKKLRSSN